MSAPDPKRQRRWCVLGGVVLLAIVAALLAPAISYPFLSLDDHYFVVSNPAIRDLSWHGITRLFLEDQRDFRYFPTTYLSFALDYRVFGLDPRAFHATNVVLHLANTALVFVLLRALLRDTLASAVASLLFGIHPLQVESVAWVMSRKNVLFLFFYLLSALGWIAFVRWKAVDRARAAVALAASLVVFLLAATAKPAAVTLPGALVLIDYLLAEPAPRRWVAFLRASVPSKLLYVPIVLLVDHMTRALATRSPFLTSYPFDPLEWVVITGHNFAWYLMKAVAPIHLGVFYPVPDPNAPLPASFALLAVAAAGVVGLTLYSFRCGHRTLFFGLAWYLVTISPMAVLTLFFSDLPLLAADRYFYQSAIGPFAIAGVAASRMWQGARARPCARASLATAGGTVAIALWITSWVQRDTWSSSTALYEQVVRHHPSDQFYYFLALEYAESGEPELAQHALQEADAAPHRVFFTRLLIYDLRISELYRRDGNFARAARFLEEGIEATPNAIEPADARSPLAYRYLADLYARAGDREKAAAFETEAQRAGRESSGYFEDLWLAAAPDAARAFLERRVTFAPDDALAWHTLARHYRDHGQPERAAECARRADSLGLTR